MKKIIKHEYVAPWETAFDSVLTPLDDFIHRQTTSGILLIYARLWLFLLPTVNEVKPIIISLRFNSLSVYLDFNYRNHFITGSTMA